jgi:hypothetical protein
MPERVLTPLSELVPASRCSGRDPCARHESPVESGSRSYVAAVQGLLDIASHFIQRILNPQVQNALAALCGKQYLPGPTVFKTFGISSTK